MADQPHERQERQKRHTRHKRQESGVDPDLSFLTRLYELSTRLVLSSGLESLLEEVLHAVIELQGADFGNVQLYDPESETLSIVAQKGFGQSFLDVFRRVSARDSSACGLALVRRERVIIFDTETDPDFQAFRDIAALSGFRAVQSTPLFTRAGDVLGMLSTHFRLPHRPTMQELRLTDLYVKQASEMIERQRLEEELRKANETLLAEIQVRERVEREREQQTQQLWPQGELLELAHDAILVRDPQSRVLSWNRGAQDLYGWTAEEMLGRVTHAVLQTRFPISPEAVDRQLAEEGQWDGELAHTARDGRQVVVESRQVLVRDAHGQPSAILEINRDITERRRLEVAERTAHQAVERERALLQRVLDELPGGAYLVRGADAQLVLANRAAQTMWGAHWERGQSLAAFLQTSGVRYFTENDQPLAPDDLVTLQIVRGGPMARQQREVLRRTDGTQAPVLLSAVAFDAMRLDASPQSLPTNGPGGAPHSGPTERAALIMAQDITLLQEAERLKDEFIALAAHELRTPVTVISTYTQMLAQRIKVDPAATARVVAVSEWHAKALNTIQQTSKRLAELTEDLLDITRLQAGRLELRREPHDVVALAHRVTQRMQSTATERHILTVQAAEEPLVVDIDVKRIEQVLTNLLSNAIKYSPDGGAVTMTVQTNSAAVKVAEIAVHDDGIGIPEDQQAQIFGRFARALNARERKIEGTGLGLYLCRELLELHDGHIWFESANGAGTTFFLTLPLAALGRDEAAEASGSE